MSPHRKEDDGMNYRMVDRGDYMDYEKTRRRKGDDIIRCSVEGCSEPAIYLDHLWPYHSELNRCKEHNKPVSSP